MQLGLQLGLQGTQGRLEDPLTTLSTSWNGRNLQINTTLTKSASVKFVVFDQTNPGVLLLNQTVAQNSGTNIYASGFTATAGNFNYILQVNVVGSYMHVVGPLGTN
jgi:hypothetical protein